LAPKARGPRARAEGAAEGLHHLVAAAHLGARTAPSRVKSGRLGPGLRRLRRRAGHGRPRPGRAALEKSQSESENDNGPAHSKYLPEGTPAEETPEWRNGFRQRPALDARRARGPWTELPGPSPPSCGMPCLAS